MGRRGLRLRGEELVAFSGPLVLNLAVPAPRLREEKAKLQKQLQEERLLRAQARAQAEVKKKVREAPRRRGPGAWQPQGAWRHRGGVAWRAHGCRLARPRPLL